MQDVRVGFPGFERDFVIQGNDERRLRTLFEAQPEVHLEVLDDEGRFHRFPPETDELCFLAAGLIEDRKVLEGLFELFAETLDQLCRIGAASEGKPEIEL